METEEEKPKFSLNRLARQGITASRLLIVIAVLSAFISFTVRNCIKPYNIEVVIVEVAIALSTCFTIIRMNTFKPQRKYDPKFLAETTQFNLLMNKITNDITRFDEAASYYFTGVRAFKYTTMILAGISTVLLGLNLTDFLPNDWKKLYPELAKNIAFVIGAIITVYTGLMTYWNIEKYWIQNKTVANKLRALKDAVENQQTAAVITPDQLQLRFDEYQAIKNDFYKYWEGAISGQGAQNAGAAAAK